MALQGSISDFGLSDIFQLILHQKKTGILVLKSPTEETRVFFEKGMVVLAEPTNQDPLNRIGEKFLKTGRITEEQLSEALARQKKSKEKIGQILLKTEAISKNDLLKAMNLQVKETLYNLFRIKEGEYSFRPQEVQYDKNLWEPLNTEFIIMEGVRRVDEWPLIEKAIPSLDMVFGKIAENASKIQGVKEEDEDNLDDMFGDAPSPEGLFLTPDEMAVYQAIDGSQSVKQIVEAGSLGEFDACKALNNLVTAGLVQSLKVPQKTPSAPLKIKVKTSPPREALLTGRNFGTVVVFAGLFGLLALNLSNVGAFSERTLNVFKPYKDLMHESQMERIDFAVQAYRLDMKKFPEDLESVVEAGYLPPDLLLDPWGREIVIQTGENASSYDLVILDTAR